MNFKFLIFILILFSSHALAGSLENVVLLEMIKNGGKTAKNHCELGNGKVLYIRDFIASYINWTFTSKNLDKKFLKCKKAKDDTSIYSCDFKYSEKARKGIHPGWDMDLEFKYTGKKGVDWSSVQCVSTP